MSDTSSRIWMGLGFVGGFFAAVFLFSTGLALAEWKTAEGVFHHLKDWQTLIAGILAVAVAIVTIFWLEKQITLAREQEEDRRERKQYADRAAMPSALSQLVKYGRANLAILVGLRAGLNPSGRIIFDRSSLIPTGPKFPADAAETIRTCLESTDKDKREPIKQILTDLQIFSSRIEGIAPDVTSGSTKIFTEANLASYIVSALDFIVRCDRTIPYAREQETHPPKQLSRGDIGTAAFFANIHEIEFPLVFVDMKRLYPSDENQT